MSDLKTSIIVDLKGNLDRQLKRNTQSINKFSRNGGRDLDRMDKKTRRLSAGFGKLAGRLTGAAIAYKAFQSASKVVDFDARVTQLQTSGNYSDSEIDSLKSKIFEVANQRDIRLSPDALLAAVQKVIEKTGDKEFAVANIRNIALAARSTGSSLQNVAAVTSSLYVQNIRTAEGIQNALDTAVLIGEAGAIGFNELSRIAPKLLSSMGGLGLSGKNLTAELVALVQIAEKAKGSAEESVTAISAFAAEIIKEEVQQELTKRGVNVRDENGAFKLPAQLVLEINKAFNGSVEALGKVFSQESVVLFKGLNNEGVPELLKRLLSIRGDGSEIRKDALKNASTAKAALQSISNKGGQIADTIFSGPTKQAADTFNAAEMLPALIKGSYKYFFTQQPEQNKVQSEQAVQKSKIELEITSDAAVKVKSITSDNLDIEVDTGLTMGAN